MAKKKSGSSSGMIGGIRSPMAKPAHGLVKTGPLSPSVAANTTRPDIKKGSAPIRSPYNKGAIARPK